MISSVLSGYWDFLLQKNIIQTSIGFILATRINYLTNIIVDTTFIPVINALLPKGGDGDILFENRIVDIFGVKIPIGKLIAEILRLILISFVLYYVFIHLIHNKFFNVDS